MKKILASSLALAGLWVGVSSEALAHVAYFDLNAAPSYTTTFTRNGWINGTDDVAHGAAADGSAGGFLGDSHAMAFFKFTLTQASDVTIDFKAVGVLNPAFSLYSGLLPDEGHDNTTTDPLNAEDPVSGLPIPHPTDPYWDSANIREGQFNAFGKWSMANDAGDAFLALGGDPTKDPTMWSEINYITHKNDNTVEAVNQSESLKIFLKPGDYTIAAAGATITASTALRSGTLSFSAVPTAVPVPAAIWLFGSALAGMGVIGRRRKDATA